MTGFNAPGKISGAQNMSYFLTDGLPTYGAGTTSTLTGSRNGSGSTQSVEDVEINPAEELLWTTFLNSNHITAHALAMGGPYTSTGSWDGQAHSSQYYLDPVAHDGQTGTNTDGLVVSNLSQLTDVLLGTIQIPAKVSNLLTGDLGSNDAGFGADGGGVTALTIDGTTYTFDHATGLVEVTGGSNRSTYDSATHTITITTVRDGKLIVEFDTGKYTYEPSKTENGYQEVIGYTVVDNDGDAASGEQTLNVYRVEARDDVILTNANLNNGQEFSIPVEALLANDTFANITGLHSVSNATGGSAVLSGDVVTFTTSGGSGAAKSFNYSISEGGLIESAGVTLVRGSVSNNGNTVTGTNGNDILIARNGASSTLNGGNGDDWLISGSGGDTLNGGNGNDILIGGTGDDTLTGGAGADRFVFDGTINNGADRITDFNVGQGDKLAFIGISSLADLGDVTAQQQGNNQNIRTTLAFENGSSVRLDGISNMGDAMDWLQANAIII